MYTIKQDINFSVEPAWINNKLSNSEIWLA